MQAIVAFANLSTEAQLVAPLLEERAADALLRLAALPGVRADADVVWRSVTHACAFFKRGGPVGGWVDVMLFALDRR